MLPIHRLSKDTFLSVMRTGALMSLHQLRHLDADSIFPLVISNAEIAFQLLENPGPLIPQFVNIVIELTIAEVRDARQKGDPSVNHHVDPRALPAARQQYNHQKSVLEQNLSVECRQIVEERTRGIAKAAYVPSLTSFFLIYLLFQLWSATQDGRYLRSGSVPLFLNPISVFSFAGSDLVF